LGFAGVRGSASGPGSRGPSRRIGGSDRAASKAFLPTADSSAASILAGSLVIGVVPFVLRNDGYWWGKRLLVVSGLQL
jgi:hypothetical protein